VVLLARLKESQFAQVCGYVDLRAFQRQNSGFQVADFNEEFGRGEWIRTTGLLVLNQALYQAAAR